MNMIKEPDELDIIKIPKEDELRIYQRRDIIFFSYKGILYEDILSIVSISLFDDYGMPFDNLVLMENIRHLRFTTKIRGLYLLIDGIKESKHKNYVKKLKLISNITEFLDLPF